MRDQSPVLISLYVCRGSRVSAGHWVLSPSSLPIWHQQLLISLVSLQKVTRYSDIAVRASITSFVCGVIIIVVYNHVNEIYSLSDVLFVNYLRRGRHRRLNFDS